MSTKLCPVNLLLEKHIFSQTFLQRKIWPCEKRQNKESFTDTLSRYIFKNQDKVDESGPWDSNPGLSQLNHDSSNVRKSIVV